MLEKVYSLKCGGWELSEHVAEIVGKVSVLQKLA